MEFFEDLTTVLNAAGLGSAGTDIFIGPAASIPNGDGPFISIDVTGGLPATRTHNEIRATVRPTAQIITRAASYRTAEARAKAALSAVDGKFNQTINGTFYLKIVSRQSEPSSIGLDDRGRPMFSFNVEAERRT